MQRIAIFTALLVALICADVSFSACTGTRLTATEISDTFAGQLVCGVATSGGNRWAEEHLSGGALWEHAKGENDPVDPRHLVGTWTTAGGDGDGVVTYTYNSGGGTYSWAVFNDSGTYMFCTTNGTSDVASATLHTIPTSTATNPCGF